MYRWHHTEFGLLLPGYWFKASRTNTTWWIKKDDTTATSENGELTSKWFSKDGVWVDISLSFYRDRFAVPK